jgi:hypothetical protein
MSHIEIEFPDYFDDNQGEIQAKGYLEGVILTYQGKRVTADFYGPLRLSQDISDELSEGYVVAYKRLIVVPEVTRECIEKTVARLWEDFFD